MGLACPLPQPTRGSGSVRFAGEGWRCLTPNPLDEDDLPTGGRKFRSGGRLRPSGPVSAENVAFFLLLKPVCDLKICQECVCNRGSAPDTDGGAHKSQSPVSLVCYGGGNSFHAPYTTPHISAPGLRVVVLMRYG